MMDGKVDQLEAELTRRQQEREESAQEIKRCLSWIKMCIAVLKLPDHLVCPPPCGNVGCSLIEQKVDEVAAEIIRRQQEREDTALQYKRYPFVGMDLGYRAAAWIIQCILFLMLGAVCWRRR